MALGGFVSGVANQLAEFKVSCHLTIFVRRACGLCKGVYVCVWCGAWIENFGYEFWFKGV